MLTVLYSRKKTKACSKRMNEPILVILWMSFFVLWLQNRKCKSRQYNNTWLLVHRRFIALPRNELLTQYFFYMHCLLLLSWIDMRGWGRFTSIRRRIKHICYHEHEMQDSIFFDILGFEICRKKFLQKIPFYEGC